MEALFGIALSAEKILLIKITVKLQLMVSEMWIRKSFQETQFLHALVQHLWLLHVSFFILGIALFFQLADQFGRWFLVPSLWV